MAPLRPKLSTREWEILRLKDEGKTWKEIEEMLKVSQNTLKSYSKRIFRKTKATTMAEAAFKVAGSRIAATAPAG